MAPSAELYAQKPKAYKVLISGQITNERYEADLLASLHHNWKKAYGKVALTIKEGSSYQLYDTLYIQGAPKLIQAPLNPEEFDYKAYSKNHGIVLQHYIQDKDVLAHHSYEGLSLRKLAYELRIYFSRRLRSYLKDPDIASIAEALILGMRSEINPELVQAYAQTGTIHVLAVSGMHVGILFASIVWIFSSVMGPNHKVKYSILALLCMWFFALVTGFSPSVLRAAVMYTVYQVGIMYGRKVDLPNTLFSSAFIILVFHPFMLFDVGFQLSFFAVVGIVVFQPFFQQAIEVQHILLKNLRDLVTVSISAQLGVLPLSLFYFKQFPNLFIISNLIEVALSSVALYIGLLCMVFMAWDFAMLCLCKILGFFIEMMNLVAHSLSQLPFAITKAYVYSWEALCIAGIVLAFAMCARWKKILFLKAATLLILVLCSMLSLRYYRIMHEEKAIIYAYRKINVVDIYKKGVILRIGDTENMKYSAKIMQTLEINQLKNCLSPEVKHLNLKKQRSLSFTVNSKKISILNDNRSLPKNSADIVFLNYGGEPLAPTYHCLLVVSHERMAQKLKAKGYQNIHCLETAGALSL